MKVYILIASLCFSRLAMASPYLEYRTGKKVRHLTAHFDHVYSIMREFKSRPIEVVLKGASDEGLMKGEARNCRIGAHSIPNSHVSVRFNSMETLPLQSVNDYITIVVHIKNQARRSGNVNCDYLSVNLLQ